MAQRDISHAIHAWKAIFQEARDRCVLRVPQELLQQNKECNIVGRAQRESSAVSHTLHNANLVPPETIRMTWGSKSATCAPQGKYQFLMANVSVLNVGTESTQTHPWPPHAQIVSQGPTHIT